MRWYQSATINGVKMQGMRKGDTSEDRWNALIKPLLPFKGEGRIFTELGSNAGFYLRKAKELGFEAQGIDNSKEFVNQANYWEEQDPKGVKTIEGSLVDYNIPCSSIVLIACVHYWITPEEVQKLLAKLKEKALYVLVVSRLEPRRNLKSPCDSRTLRRNFRKWRFKEIKSVRTKRHYSILFKNDLIEKDVTEAMEATQMFGTKMFFPAFTKFLDGDEKEYSKYMWYFRREGLLRKHRMLLEDIKLRGITEPILIDGTQVINGNHRLVIAYHLGIKKILCIELINIITARSQRN